MPRARQQSAPTKGRVIEVIETGDGTLSPEEIEPDDLELEIAKGEFAGVEGASVTIYRQGIHGRDLTFIDTIPPSNFTMAMLKHPPYNGGKFRVMMRDSHGTVRLNRVEQVEPAPKEATPVNGVPQSAISGELLGKAMIDGFGRVGDAIARLGELIVMQANRTPVAPPEQKSLMDLLGDVKALRELINPVSVDPLDQLSKVVGVVREMRGGGDDDDRPARGSASEMDVLLETARAILPALAQHAQQGQAQQHPPMIPAPQPTMRPPVPPQPTGVPQVQFDPTDMMLKFLVQQAANNNDPGAYAVMVLDNVPPEIVDQYMNRADWFDELVKRAPEAANHRLWFERLHAAIGNYLTESNDGGKQGGESLQGTPPADAGSPGS